MNGGGGAASFRSAPPIFEIVARRAEDRRALPAVTAGYRAEETRKLRNPNPKSQTSNLQITKSLYSGFTVSAGGRSMPAATVAFVAGSMRMKEPVRRLVE